MPEGTPATEPPAGTAPTPAPAATATTTTQPATLPAAPAAEETISLEEARKLRKESQSLRERLRGFEQADTERQRAAMSETDRLKAEAEQERTARLAAEQERDRLAAQQAIERAAVKAGLDPELATSLLPTDQLERDEAGKFTSVDRAIKKLLERWPHLAAAPAPPGSPANPPRGATSVLTREDLARLSPEEINRRWDEVQRVLAG